MIDKIQHLESVLSWGARNPAFIVFLIDQSASMTNTSLGGGPRAEIAAHSIQNAIIDIVNKCTSGKEVKKRAFITVIGYGSCMGDAHIIRLGWTDEWAQDVVNAKANGSCIIPIRAEAIPNMEDGFFLAKECCEEWISSRYDSDHQHLGPLIIINLTKGSTINEEEAIKLAKGLVSLQNTHLCNIIIPSDVESYKEVFFPSINPLGDDLGRGWLFEISSKLPSDSLDAARLQGHERIDNNSRCFAISSSTRCATIFVEPFFYHG